MIALRRSTVLIRQFIHGYRRCIANTCFQAFSGPNQTGSHEDRNRQTEWSMASANRKRRDNRIDADVLDSEFS
jgi:hypothetical protein